MKSIWSFLVFPILTATSFATTSTAVTWTATLTIQTSGGVTGAILSGNSTMSLGSGTITANILHLGNPTIPIPYTVTFSGGGTLTGILSLPQSAINAGGSMIISATVSSGTGEYAGYTGSFPTLTGTSSGSSGPSLVGITITFSGTGTLALGGTPPPTITDVVDAGSYNADPQIAQGSIFVVTGSGLSNPGTFNESFPLPTTSTNSSAGGVSIAFTPQSGGAGTNAYLIYEYSQGTVNQLAAVLPSTLAPGVYNVTVTSNGITSPTFQTTVVSSKPELFTVDATGNGMGLVQNYVSSSELDLNRFTTGTVDGYTISPAHPGQTLIAYATGLGPITSPDNVAASPANTFGSIVQVIVGGRTITPSYAGRAPGFSGLDQINFTLPENVPTSCAVVIEIQEDGLTRMSHLFISIAPTGSSACTYSGYTTSQLQNLDNGELVYAGDFLLTESAPGGAGTAQTGSGGGFYKYSGAELPAIPVTGAVTPPQQGCTVSQLPLPPQSVLFPAGAPISIDAGTITLNGPSGSGASNEVLSEANNTYAGIVTAIPAGTWTVSGSGGASVGPFTANITTGAPFTITGRLPTNIVRANGFTINWTGGNSTDPVTVTGVTETFSKVADGVVATAGAAFLCTTTAGAGSLTVPASITSQLLAVSAAQQTAQTASSSLSVVTGPSPTTFTAPLVNGGSISNAIFSVSIGAGGEPTFQ